MPFTNAYLRSKGRKNHKAGVWAERAAARRLKLYGFEVLEERYKTKEGEIDLIAKRDGLLVFVEVKQRKNTLEEAITHTQMQRIIHSAMLYLAAHDEYANFTMRFDAMLYQTKGKLLYVPHAWTADLF